jgi:hypothetical protein
MTDIITYITIGFLIMLLAPAVIVGVIIIIGHMSIRKKKK